MAKKDTFVYRIRHIESGNYFVTPKGKSMWSTAPHAKTSFVHHTKEYFDLQKNHEIAKFKLVEVKLDEADKPKGFYYQ